MERVETLCNLLNEKLHKKATISELLTTVKMIESELLHLQKITPKANSDTSTTAINIAKQTIPEKQTEINIKNENEEKIIEVLQVDEAELEAELEEIKKNVEDKQSGIAGNNRDTSLKDSIQSLPKKIKEEAAVNDSIKKDTKKVVQSPLGEEFNFPTGNVLQWSVQFYTSPSPIPDKHKIYIEFDDVKEDFENGIYKYSTGLLPNKGDAVKLQAKLRQKGYKDSFVVVFFNNKKISVKEATEKSLK